MKNSYWLLLLPLVLLTGCKGQKKLTQYSELYQESPAVIYIAPLNDRSERHPMRTADDSVYNASLNVATKQLYLTASDPLVHNGYYVLGPLASAQLAATESRTGNQLRTENIQDYHTNLGIDAILFITLHRWENTSNSWTAEVEYALRSTQTGSEIMHVYVRASKQLPTDLKGNPKPLGDDLDFAEKYGCDLETAQRCRLVEILNQYILKDLPSGKRSRGSSVERYVPSHPDYINLNINPNGSVEILKGE
ncbi:MAG: hypothetical protein IK010_01590 [Bacteroidales bacterium]|nr:hypothetical protein [Bacteroidales bacterium]MBR5092271.1 hypothetical protein [Bacteroidales bacterium]